MWCGFFLFNDFFNSFCNVLCFEFYIILLYIRDLRLFELKNIGIWNSYRSTVLLEYSN